MQGTPDLGLTSGTRILFFFLEKNLLFIPFSFSSGDVRFRTSSRSHMPPASFLLVLASDVNVNGAVILFLIWLLGNVQGIVLTVDRFARTRAGGGGGGLWPGLGPWAVHATRYRHRVDHIFIQFSYMGRRINAHCHRPSRLYKPLLHGRCR